MVPGAVIILLVVGVPLATAMYRVYEVPGADLPPEFLATTDVTAESSVDERLYHSALLAFPGLNSLESGDPLSDSYFNVWVEENEEVINRLVEATGKVGVASERIWPRGEWDQGLPHAAAAALMIKSRRAEAEAKLDEAWNYYKAALNLAHHLNDGNSGLTGVHFAHGIEQGVFRQLVPWAMHVENTAERVELAAAFLEEHRRRQPELHQVVKGDYDVWMSWLDDLVAIYPLMNAAEQQRSELLHLAPWELNRTRRLLRYSFSQRLNELEVENDHRAEAIRQAPRVDEKLSTIAESTLLGRVTTGILDYFATFAHGESQRIGAVYQLAAIAYHREHGNYPEDFTSLKVGEYAMPDDFFSPGRKLLIASFSSAQGAEHIRGPLIVSYRVRDTAKTTFSDGDYDARHFELPIFEDWSEREVSGTIAG